MDNQQISAWNITFFFQLWIFNEFPHGKYLIVNGKKQIFIVLPYYITFCPRIHVDVETLMGAD